MRHFLLFSVTYLFLFAPGLNAQSPLQCGTSGFYNYQVEAGARSADWMEQVDQQLKVLQTDPVFRTDQDTQHYVIPIAYHIMHNGGPEEVPEQNILQSLEDLNEAFANEGYYDPGTGAPIDISFCFARRDKYGRETEGYEWINSSDYYIVDDYDISNQIMTIFAWNPRMVLNIYSVGEIDFATAFATFPPQDPEERRDGVVTEYGMIGYSKAGAAVLAHEIGHYLGLYHTFHEGCQNDDCLLQGDRVCDTPPDNYANTFEGCISNNNCTTDADDPRAQNPFTNDVPDMNINYMDYNNITCYNAFTEGQRTRMRYVLRSLRPSLTNSPACDVTLPSLDVSIYTLKNLDEVCFGDSLRPQVRIINNGLQNLSRLELILKMDDVPFDTVSWEGLVRGEGRLTWVDIPPFTAPEPGQHEFSILTHLPNGLPDMIPQNDTAQFSFVRPHEGFLPHFEDFEKGYSDQWILWERIEDEWQIKDMGDSCETFGQKAITVQNFLYAEPLANYLYSPIFDLALHDDAIFAFSHSFARQGELSFLQYLSVDLIRESEPNDPLRLYFSTQVGLLDAIVYDSSAPWLPSDCDHWTEKEVELEDFTGERVVLKVTSTVGRNNLERLYLDNFKVRSSYTEAKEEIGVEETDIKIYPVPVTGELHCDFPAFRPTDFEISIYGIDGKRVYEEKQDAFFGLYEGVYDMSQVADGMYFFRIEVDGRQIDRKLVIQK